jgi:hypothetical protein
VPNFINGPYVVSLWKHIRRSWDAFSSFVSIEVMVALEPGFDMTFGLEIAL